MTNSLNFYFCLNLVAMSRGEHSKHDKMFCDAWSGRRPLARGGGHLTGLCALSRLLYIHIYELFTSEANYSMRRPAIAGTLLKSHAAPGG